MTDDPAPVVLQWAPASGPEYVLGSGGTVSLHRITLEGGAACDDDGIQSSWAPAEQKRRTSERWRCVVPQLSCLDWSPRAALALSATPLIAVGASSGRGLSLVRSSDGAEAAHVRTAMPPRPARPCAAVAWQGDGRVLAAGLERERSARADSSCVFLWDCGALAPDGGGAPAFAGALGQNESATALSWNAHMPATLAVGTGHMRGQLRVYDIRLAGDDGRSPAGAVAEPIGREGSRAALSVLAHAKTVRGVATEPHEGRLLATWSDGAGDEIKIWDLRRLDPGAPKPVLTIRPSLLRAAPVSAKPVASCAWSPAVMGSLATALVGDSAIILWDTRTGHSQPLESPVRVRNIRAPQGTGGSARGGTELATIAWARSGESVSRPAEQDAASLAFPHRLLAAVKAPQGGGGPSAVEVFDFTMHETMPLSLGPCGDVALGCGRAIFSMRPQPPGDDIADTIRFRAASGYGMDEGKNLQVLTDELDMALEKLGAPSDASLLGLIQLIRMWLFIAHVEAEGDAPYADAPDPAGAKGPCDGIDIDPHEPCTPSVCANLGCPVYQSPRRQVALRACGWSPAACCETAPDDPDSARRRDDELEKVMAECEMSRDEGSSQFERSAALALWHGDPSAAVSALNRGASAITSVGAAPLEDEGALAETDAAALTAASALAETFHIVAMAIAGFVGSGGDRRLWRNTCASVLARPALACSPTDSAESSARAYLNAICETLLAIATAGEDRHSDEPALQFSRVLDNDAIALGDRVAFACRFLPQEALAAFVSARTAECIKHGNLEGLFLPGLGPRATPLVQAYVDLTGDVQTAALVVARWTTPSHATARDEPPPDGDASSEASTARTRAAWIDAYRDLLNAWQLWEARVLFDVGRRERSARSAELSATSSGGAPASQTFASAGDAAPPPAIRVCCQYCAAPLPLEALRSQAETGVAGGGGAPESRSRQPHQAKYLSSWLRRQKPVLACCPACRKTLPRCYVCLLPLSCLNPHLELQRRQQRDRAGTSSVSSDNAALGALPFADWFTWCQRCKHGGHSHHIGLWFETNTVCGVSGCDCRCGSI